MLNEKIIEEDKTKTMFETKDKPKIQIAKSNKNKKIEKYLNIMTNVALIKKKLQKTE